MSQLQNLTIKAPGFAGLNTQDSPVAMPPEFASRANNCVIDQFGRIAARKGYDVLTTTNTPVDPLISMGFFEDSLGNTAIYSATSSAIYSGTVTMTEEYTTGVTAGNWQMVNFNDKMIFVQAAHAPLVASAGGTPALLNQTTSIGGLSLTGANVALGAFGRLWLASTTANKTRVFWSDLLNPATFNSGSAGSIDLEDVWPVGQDEIVGLAAHNGFLIIFGRHNIVVYSGPEEPATMQLADTVAGIGCVSRDTIQATGNELIFLSDTGIRGLGRTIQEQSLPNTDLSGNVRDELTNLINITTNKANFKSIYSPEEGFYVLYLSEFSVAYVLDMRRALPETGYHRVTKWTNSPFTCFTRDWQTGVLYVGGAQGVGQYKNYQDNSESYFMSYYTHQMDFGQPVTLKFLKKIRPIIIGTSATTSTIKWGFDFQTPTNSSVLGLLQVTNSEFGVSQFGIGEFGSATGLNILNVNANGSGSQVQVGVEVNVDGSEFSIQELTMYATIGRVTW